MLIGRFDTNEPVFQKLYGVQGAAQDVRIKLAAYVWTEQDRAGEVPEPRYLLFEGNSGRPAAPEYRRVETLDAQRFELEVELPADLYPLNVGVRLAESASQGWPTVTGAVVVSRTP